ncbi:MAG: TonB-dependent receptor [Acidobacteria bacterium]|nr:TonB-dependent receptor [Acidobacteriota bacterium]
MCKYYYKSLKLTSNFICVLILTFYLSTVALAQSGSTTGAIALVVRDSQGASLSSATITVRQLETNLIRNSQTNEDGSCTIFQLPPGSYEISVKADGFEETISTVYLNIGNTLLKVCDLTVGSSKQVIEILGDSFVREGKTESSSTIASDRINSLPINRRNFLDFSLTTPRVVQDRVPTQGVSASSGLSFNGQSARINNITIDGLDNNETATGAVRATFSQDAIQEFQVVSDSYSAEFGRAAGGVINIVTKGGSNNIHSTVFFLNRSDKTSARDVFTPFEPNYEQYQFGATLSGAIKKDKIFFFSSFERLSIKQNQFVTIGEQTVKSAKNLGFTLSNGAIPFSLGNTSFLNRVDLRLSSKDNLFIRYNFGGSYNGNFDPFGALIGETNAGIQRLKDNNIAISNIYATSNLAIETRFIYAKRNQEIDPIENSPQIRLIAPEGSVRFGRATLLPQPRKTPIFQIVNNFTLTKGKNQIKFGVDFANIDPDDKSTLPIFNGGLALFVPLNFSQLVGIPNLPSFSGLEAFDPSLRSSQQIAFLKTASAAAPMIFPGFPEGLPLETLPLPFAYVQGFGNTRISVQQRLFSAFIQDDIKLKSNLIVKIGLRYDIGRERFIPNNNGNFSPRLALSYSPNKIPKLNLRASYGIFFGVQPFAVPGVVELTTVKKSLSIPVIPFPFSILPFSLPGHKFPESTQVPSDIKFTPQLNTTFQYQPDFRNGYTQQITTGFDYFLNQNTILGLSYNYVRGVKFLGVRDINPVVRPIINNPLDSQVQGRVDPSRGTVFEVESAFDSYYNGLTIAIDRRISNKLNILAYYTYSKAIDNFLDFRFDIQETVDPLKPGNERGLSLQDARSRFVVSGLVELGKYFNTPFLQNTQLSTIITLESGHPYNLIVGEDLNLNADNPPGDRPNELGRNVGVMPGFASVDLRLSRSIQINEKLKFQVIAECFNLFNRVNISEVDRVFPKDSQGNFHLPKQENGRFTAPNERYRNAFAPRQFQFGFRLTF